MDKNIRADFYKYLNKNCKLPEEIEDKLLKLNLIITNSFTQQNQDDQNFNKKDDKNNIKIEDENNQMTSTYKTIKSSLNDIHNIEKNLNLLDTQVYMSISKSICKILLKSLI